MGKSLNWRQAVTVGVDQIQFSFNNVQWIVTVVVGIYTWYVGRQSASAKEVIGLRERIIRLEADMKQMPSQEAMSTLNDRLAKVDAELDATNRLLETMAQSLNRVHDYLLNHK
jgi:uncharacterized coiled-coil protein SlyX